MQQFPQLERARQGGAVHADRPRRHGARRRVG